MVTWLTRSLIFIVGGAVLAFAVTTSRITYHSPKHGATLDVHTVGAILLLVGVFDLILNFCVSLYLRDTGQPLDPYVTNAAGAALGTPLAGQTVTRQVYATAPNVAVPPAAPVAQPVYAEPAQPAYVQPVSPCSPAMYSRRSPPTLSPFTRQATRGRSTKRSRSRSTLNSDLSREKDWATPRARPLPVARGISLALTSTVRPCGCAHCPA